MKTQYDPRHRQRIRLMQALYSRSFEGSREPPDLEEDDHQILAAIKQETDKINQHINQYANKFSTDKMARLDLAILQLAVYELLHRFNVPYRVVIDESIELAKEFGGFNTPRFINGILANIIKEFPKRA